MFKVLLLLLAGPVFAQTPPTTTIGQSPIEKPSIAKPTIAKATKTAATTYKIKQVIKTEHTVVIQASQTVDFAPGKLFLATFPDGDQCPLTLRDVNDKILTFDSSTCEHENRLNLKVPVEPSMAAGIEVKNSPATTAAPVAATGKTEKGPRKSFFDGRFGIILSGSTAKNIKFNEGEYKTGGSTYDFETTIKSQMAPSIGVSYSRMEPHAWGFSGSLVYEFPRELKSFSVTTGGGSASGFSTGTTKLSIFLVEANMLYRWDHIYLPFGMNVSIPYTSGGGADHDAFGPMVGAYGGAGYMVTEDAAIEVFARLIGLTIKDDNTPGAEVDYGSGYLAGLGASLKYWF